MDNKTNVGGAAIEPTPVLDALTVERLFCLAVLQEGPDVTARVLSRFLDYRTRKDEVLAQILCTPDPVVGAFFGSSGHFSYNRRICPDNPLDSTITAITTNKMYFDD